MRTENTKKPKKKGVLYIIIILHIINPIYGCSMNAGVKCDEANSNRNIKRLANKHLFPI